jgi:hypothetical protein
LHNAKWDINVNPTVELNISGKLKGRYKLQVVREDGSIRLETPWFDNIITNQGLDQIGGAQGHPLNSPNAENFLNSVCSVGTGTTVPAITDTQLTSYGAASATPGGGQWGGTLGYVAGPPSYWSCVWTYTFNAGVATGTWSEIGVGNFYSNTDTQPWLFSHALILDSLGNPTTISVLSTEALVATYELDYYINTTTNAYSFQINTTTYSGNYLRANVATAPSFYLGCTYDGVNISPTVLVYNGTIGPITGGPSGTGAGGGSTTQPSAYLTGSYYNTFSTTFGISNGNVSGGISAFTISAHFAGQWQFSVSPVIPKTSSYQLTLNYNISWARYP